MITPRQIRAARGLLGWDATELGGRAGIHRQTITNIECGRTQPHADSINRIRQTLSDAGVEFLANQGVRLKSSDVEIYEGPERFQDFIDFVYEQIAAHGGDICLSVTDESLFSKYRRDTKDHYERMQRLYNEGGFNSFRILANKSNFANDYTYNTYKQLPGEALAPTAFYTFANYLALISFVHTTPPYVLVVESPPLASSYRKAFDIAWAAASEPPKAAKP